MQTVFAPRGPAHPKPRPCARKNRRTAYPVRPACPKYRPTYPRPPAQHIATLSPVHTKTAAPNGAAVKPFCEKSGQSSLGKRLLNLSSASAQTTPTTKQIRLGSHAAAKLPNGMMTSVAAMTMPTMAWNAKE